MRFRGALLTLSVLFVLTQVSNAVLVLSIGLAPEQQRKGSTMATDRLTLSMAGLHPAVSWNDMPNKSHWTAANGKTLCGLDIPTGVDRAWFDELGMKSVHACKSCLSLRPVPASIQAQRTTAVEGAIDAMLTGGAQ